MYREKFELSGKVAIVTGASRGIGEAIAKGLSEFGAKVVLASRKQEVLDEVRKEIEETGGEALAVATHVGNLEAIDGLIKTTLDAYGRIDILVNNAATNPYFGPTADADMSFWDKIFEVNARGMFYLTQQVGKVMVEQGSGSIINISSEAAFKPTPFLGIYSVSKAAVNMITKVFAGEWGSRGVRVNCVAPGLVKTHFSQALWGNEAILDTAVSTIPMGRIAEPDEMVGMIVYLASDAASFVTGQVFVLDGGRELN
jgi:dehydrogenase/reductase SDR family protein 4